MTDINKGKAEATLVTVALVLRMPLEAISRLKEMVQSIWATKIVYQRVSVGHLKIVEEERGDGE